MIESILSVAELKECIKAEKMTVIMFRANWCNTCKLIKPNYEKLAMKYCESNLKFARADIDYIGVENLQKVKIDLNLGAIPSFCIYKSSELIEQLVTGSNQKLEEFIRSYIDEGKLPASDNANTNEYTYGRVMSATPPSSHSSGNTKKNSDKSSQKENNTEKKSTSLKVPQLSSDKSKRSPSASPQRDTGLTVPSQSWNRSASNSRPTTRNRGKDD